MLKQARSYAILTPEPCQGRKAAALRDAWDRRSVRVKVFCGDAL